MPGQFVNVKVREDSFDPLLRIPLGIHAITGTGVKLLYKVVGKATKCLSRKKPGEDISILGPLGNGFDLDPVLTSGGSAFVVSGGHGIAPLYALCGALAKKKININFFHGVQTGRHLTCEKELKELGVTMRISSVDGSIGSHGNVTEDLEKEINNSRGINGSGIIYACGPRAMLKEVARIARESDITAQVSLDAYIACGIGVCLGCAVKTRTGYKMVCKDGPVFDAREIAWEEIAC
jgi:dihydroorotate dehydrogenase electron transfer subunit